MVAGLDKAKLAFWTWGMDDWTQATTLGILAEYIVQHEVGEIVGQRDPFAPYDVLTRHGLTGEVKFSGGWNRVVNGTPVRVFDIEPKHRSGARGGTAKRRVSDLWFFASLALCPEGAAADAWALDAGHWAFYVCSTPDLDRSVGNQRTINEVSLAAHGIPKMAAAELGPYLDDVARGTRQVAKLDLAWCGEGKAWA